MTTKGGLRVRRGVAATLVGLILGSGAIAPLTASATVYAATGEDDVASTITLGAPSAPTNFRIIGGLTDTATPAVAFDWDPPADAGASPITGYTIEGNGGVWNFSAGAGNVLIHGDFTNDTTYVFTLTAINAQGRSSGAIVEVPWGFQPAAPTAVTAQVTEHYGSTAVVTVGWAAPTDTGGWPVEQYIVTTVDDQGVHRSCYANTDDRQCRVLGVPPGQRTFTVRARTEVGTSETAAVGPIFIAANPDPVRDVNVIAGDQAIQASWQPPAGDGGSPVIGYEVIVSGQVHRTTDLHYTVTGLENGQMYRVTVRAVNEVGAGSVGEFLVVPATANAGQVSWGKHGAYLAAPPTVGWASPTQQCVDVPVDLTVRTASGPGHPWSATLSVVRADGSLTAVTPVTVQGDRSTAGPQTIHLCSDDLPPGAYQVRGVVTHSLVTYSPTSYELRSAFEITGLTSTTSLTATTVGGATQVSGRVQASDGSTLTPASGTVALSIVTPDGTRTPVGGPQVHLDSTGAFSQSLSNIYPSGTKIEATYAGTSTTAVSVGSTSVINTPTTPPTQPPPTQPQPAPTPPKAKVSAKATSKASKLTVDVNPDKSTGYWTFQVQKKHADGSWKKVGTYKTKGTKETRTVNLPKGTYRVVVAGKYGYTGSTSAPVVVKK